MSPEHEVNQNRVWFTVKILKNFPPVLFEFQLLRFCIHTFAMAPFFILKSITELGRQSTSIKKNEEGI